MKLRLAVVLLITLLPAAALAHPTDGSLHTHASLPAHSSRMHIHSSASRRA